MRSVLKLLPLLLGAWSPVFAANTQFSSDKPIVNFRLPDFTPEGNRAWLIRGTEARYLSKAQVDIKELNLTIFSGQADGKIETLLLSPAAEIRIGDLVARGNDSIRIINDKFEASGSGWNYWHKEKRVSISRNVHVVLHTQLKSILE